MQKVDSKQGFPHGFQKQFTSIFTVAMQNLRSVSDLVSRTGNKLTALKTRAQERTLVVERVRATLPDRLALSMTRILPIELRHALHVAQLPPYHRDPFDRMLVAQALIERMPLLTADKRFSAYGVEVLSI